MIVMNIGEGSNTQGLPDNGLKLAQFALRVDVLGADK